MNSFNFQKDLKDRRAAKAARLIVRNISFKVEEKDLREFFSPFGIVTDVNVLKKSNGKLVGCAFVQFDKKLNAAKALARCSGQQFLGRPIIIDWAVSKTKFQKNNRATKQVEVEFKDEVISDEEVEVKQEILNEIDTQEKSSCDSDGSLTMKSENETEDDSDNETDNDNVSSSEDDNDSFNKVAKVKIENSSSENTKQNELDERTIFIKNVPFSASQKELAEAVKKFGPIIYAVICIDPNTEHSRGTAFVKFKMLESAEKCLQAGTEFQLNGTVLDPHKALSRDELKMKNDKKPKERDNRNLYLAKEGLILAGTKAAKEVSESDMSKRLIFERYKNQMLKNLNMFLSDKRLVVQNLPPYINDKKLKQIFIKYSSKHVKPCESKVMRYMKELNNKGKPISKGYGFVAFNTHEDALTALRSINNNPNIFTKSSRPIVSFSVENRNAIKIKEKRQLNNLQGSENKSKKIKLSENADIDDEKELAYVGCTVKPGVNIKIRQKHKLEEQAQKHRNELKISKKLIKKNTLKTARKMKKLKSNAKLNYSDDKDFANLVNKYKKQFTEHICKKKWYKD